MNTEEKIISKLITNPFVGLGMLAAVVTIVMSKMKSNDGLVHDETGRVTFIQKALNAMWDRNSRAFGTGRRLEEDGVVRPALRSALLSVSDFIHSVNVQYDHNLDNNVPSTNSLDVLPLWSFGAATLAGIPKEQLDDLWEDLGLLRRYGEVHVHISEAQRHEGSELFLREEDW